jgi:Cu/Ag efflux protein CusF
MSRHILIAVIVLAAAFAPLAASAADMEGKVQSVDTTERTFTLENGTKLWLADNVAADSVKEGVEVTVMYEQRDGKPVVTSVTIK